MDDLCKSVGLAEVRAGGAGLQPPLAEEEAATSLIGDHGPLSGGDLTWLPVHGPGGRRLAYRVLIFKHESPNNASTF